MYRANTHDLPWDEVESFIDAHPRGASLEEVGEAFGLSRERVRQLEEKALLKLALRVGSLL